MTAPAFDDDLGFPQRVEDLAVEQFVSQALMSDNWSVFAEYDYLGFTDKMVTLASGKNIGTVHQNVQVALIGVNFRFAGLFH